jgi:hypothetical protein
VEFDQGIEFPACGKLQRPAQACSNPVCKADLKKIASPLAGLRFHDLRHHAITELAESQVSDQTIMAIAGHVNQRMLARSCMYEAKPGGKLYWCCRRGQQGRGSERTESSVTTRVTTQTRVEPLWHRRKLF